MQSKHKLLLSTTSFQEALKKKDIVLIEKHLNKMPDLVNTPDKEGMTPLMEAVSKGEIKLTKLLLQYGHPLVNLAHIDLAYKACQHDKLRKYLRHQLESQYQFLGNTPDTLEKKQSQMVLAANLSLYFHYAKADFDGMESFVKKELDYITQAEKIFDEMIQQHPLTIDELIHLHLKLGKVCSLLKLETDVIKHYTFVIDKQRLQLENRGYPHDQREALIENLGKQLIILMNAHLKRGISFSKSTSSISDEYACKSYLKMLELADHIPDYLFEKQISLIRYYTALASRYLGESAEKNKRFAESVTYYVKAIQLHLNIIHRVVPQVTQEHRPVVQELARSYRRVYQLYHQGNVSLTELQKGLKALEVAEGEEIIAVLKKAMCQDENLIAQFSQAQKNLYQLLEVNGQKAQTSFWKQQEDKTETAPHLRESTISNSFQLNC